MLEQKNKTSLTQEDFVGVVDIIKSTSTIEGLLNAVPKALGATIAFYQHFPSIGAIDYSNTQITYPYNCPKELLDIYTERNKNKPGPVPVVTLRRGSFIWLSDVLKAPPLQVKKENIDFIQQIVEMVGDCIMVPLYGPDNRKGIAVIGFNRNKDAFAPLLSYQLQSLYQILHVRYCLLVKALHGKINLTGREAEVLELISIGKNNPDIAKILGISPRTVAIHASRVFIKFGTTDRISTAMRAQTVEITI